MTSIVSDSMLNNHIKSSSFMPFGINVLLVPRLFNANSQQGFGLCYAVYYLELFPTEHRYKGEILGLTFWTTGVVFVAPVAYLLRDYSWRYLQVALALYSFYSIFHYWYVLLS